MCSLDEPITPTTHLYTIKLQIYKLIFYLLHIGQKNVFLHSFFTNNQIYNIMITKYLHPFVSFFLEKIATFWFGHTSN